jgi:hypothetical protein
MSRTSKLCPRHLGQASYQYRPVADPGVKWRMHLQPAEVWLIESVYVRQHQLGSIDSGCQANSADSRGQEGQPFIMRTHQLHSYPQFIIVCEFQQKRQLDNSDPQLHTERR